MQRRPLQSLFPYLPLSFSRTHAPLKPVSSPHIISSLTCTRSFFSCSRFSHASCSRPDRPPHTSLPRSHGSRLTSTHCVPTSCTPTSTWTSPCYTLSSVREWANKLPESTFITSSSYRVTIRALGERGDDWREEREKGREYSAPIAGVHGGPRKCQREYPRECWRCRTLDS
jgi:hypothetical protein